MKPPKGNTLTTGQAAKLCNLATQTINKFFDAGQIEGYRVPGSATRRIFKDQFMAWMIRNGMLCPPKTTCPTCGQSIGAKQTPPEMDWQPPKRPKNERTKSQVLAKRRHTGGACCEDYANQQTCNCLEIAKPDPGPHCSFCGLYHECGICHDPNCTDPSGKH
jgi:excisionase family DNA binding protein